MKKQWMLLSAAILISVSVMAQTSIPWTLFHQNLVYFNPACTEYQRADSLKKMASMQYRNQGSGMFMSFQATYFQPLRNDRHTVGGYFLRDKSSNITGSYNINGLYNYKIQTGNGSLRVGLNVFVSLKTLNVEDLRLGTPPPTPPASQRTSYGLQPGISYNLGHFYAGASVHLCRDVSFFDKSVTWLKTLRFNSGYVLPFTKDVSLRGSAFLYYVNDNTNIVVLNGTICILDKIEAGISYRAFLQVNTNPYCYNVGFSLLDKRLRIQYGYDAPSGSLFRTNSHEVVTRFVF